MAFLIHIRFLKAICNILNKNLLFTKKKEYKLCAISRNRVKDYVLLVIVNYWG